MTKNSNLFFVKILFVFFISPLTLAAQNEIDTIKKKEVKYPQFQFKGLFQGRYLAGLTQDVDLQGVHHANGEFSTNSFDVKRMRVQVKGTIGAHTEVVALVNLADFKSDPKNKVLENAYIKYTFNKYIGLTLGQFRPWFGIEETYPVDIIKSMDFSNQYYEFGKNGWSSFQIGFTLNGAFDLNKIPVNYAFSVVNGNGRNQEADVDNGKQYMSRIVFGLSKKNNINFGINGGIGEVFTHKVYAFGADLTTDFQLSDKVSLDMQLEMKQAINHNLYFSIPVENRAESLDMYQMRGIYFLPNFRYAIKYKKLTAIEMSCRYEYIDTNFRLNSNGRQTLVPMLSFEFLKDYGARIQMGVQIDRYKTTVINSSNYNKELFVFQIQSRL
jgi:phosphate-selective porin